MNEWWKAAAENAELKFEAGQELAPEDIVAIALDHPEKYEIAVRLKDPS